MLAKLTICKPEELGETDRQRWVRAQQQTPCLNSPFLHPEFTNIIARRRLDVRVLIAEDHLENKAWFAFHRLKAGLARPIGAPVSDHQGMVYEPEFRASFREILDEASIGALPYTSLNDPTNTLEQFHTHSQDTHLLDLSSGPDAYFANQQQQYHKYFKKMRQRARGVVRDFGCAELVANIQDQTALKLLFQWKHKQYTRTAKLNVLNVPWIHALLENVYTSKTTDFRGLLFGYRLGGQWAAMELGLLANGVYHSWIAAYADEFSRNSPGLLLLHEIIEQAPKLGIKQIDLGRGHEHYKKYYASSLAPLHAGCVLGSGLAARQRKAVFAVCDGFSKLPLGSLSNLPGRIAGSLDYIGSCHPKPGDQIKAFGQSLVRKLSNFNPT